MAMLFRSLLPRESVDDEGLAPLLDDVVVVSGEDIGLILLPPAPVHITGTSYTVIDVQAVSRPPLGSR